MVFHERSWLGKFIMVHVHHSCKVFSWMMERGANDDIVGAVVGDHDVLVATVCMNGEAAGVI